MNEDKFNETKKGKEEGRMEEETEGSRQGREDHGGMQGRRQTEALTQARSVSGGVHVSPPLDVKRPTPRQLHRV